MASPELTALTTAFAAAGAALKAARGDGVEHGLAEYTVTEGRLVLTGMLAHKVLGLIEAGEKLPAEIKLDFEGSAKLIRFVITVMTHLGPDHPLVADHPAFHTLPPDLPLTPYHNGWP